MKLVRQDPDRYDQTLEELLPTFDTRDGYELCSRLIRPSDAPELLAFFERLSPEARRQRFHTDPGRLSTKVKRQISEELASVDNLSTGGAVLALDRDEAGAEHIVGVARLARQIGVDDTSLVEAAIVVEDAYQGRGVGTELLFRMVLLAKQMHVQTILAEFEPSNQAAINLFREINLPTEITASRGQTSIYITVPH
jgi:RimJ/RimL family protein N-acetyltransferase